MSIQENLNLECPQKGSRPRDGHGYTIEASSGHTGGISGPEGFVEKPLFMKSATHMLRNLSAKIGMFFGLRPHFGPCTHLKIPEAPILPIRVLSRPYAVL